MSCQCLKRNSTPRSALDVWLDYLLELTSQTPKKPNNVYGEIIGAHAVVKMRYPVIDCPQRRLNISFMYEEARNILMGRNMTSDFLHCEKIKEYSDNGYYFQGAYGPKVSEQMQYVVETLGSEVASRRAVISIWRES